MADYDSLNLIWGPMAGMYPVYGALRYSKLDDAAAIAASVFVCPKDGTIDRVGVHVSDITGNPSPYKVGIVTVDTNGTPTTTPAGGSAVQLYDFTVTGWHWITLTTPATVNAGDCFAAKVWADSENLPDADNYARICYGINTRTATMVPRVLFESATYDNAIGVGARYSDGEVVMPAFDTLTIEVPFASNDSPDEIGSRFQVPFDCQCYGVMVYIRTGLSGADFEIKLYTDGGTLLKSISVDASQVIDASNYGAMIAHWDVQALSADTWYRITILPTTTSDVFIYQIECNELESRQWFTEGERWYKCYRTDAGAFTDDTTTIVAMALLLNQITIGEGNGGAGGAGGMLIG